MGFWEYSLLAPSNINSDRSPYTTADQWLMAVRLASMLLPVCILMGSGGTTCTGGRLRSEVATNWVTHSKNNEGPLLTGQKVGNAYI